MKRIYSILAAVFLVLSVSGFCFVSAAVVTPGIPVGGAVELEEVTSSGAEKGISQTEYTFESEEEIQYYAYLNITAEDESLHPIILAARRIIIYRQPWVADEVEGWVKDRNGNIIATLPHFSDLFPDDWEIPIEPTGVDLSYYGR